MRLAPCLRNLYATRSITRFYKSAEVVPLAGSRFAVRLDGRAIRTPAGNLLELSSEPLAMAVAFEWQSQHGRIDMSRMHLSSLSITAIDNPNKETATGLVENMLACLDSDTLFYMSDEPEELRRLQEERWGSIIAWAKKRFDIHLSATTSLNQTVVPDSSKDRIERYLAAYSFPALLGCQLALDSLKSTLLLLATLEKKVAVEEAVELTTLERRFQTGRWGQVQWAHDVEHHDLCSRVSAGLFFAYFNSYHETKERKSSTGLVNNLIQEGRAQ